MKMKFQNLKLKTFFTILMFVLCIILGILVFCNWLNRDNIPPQISFENETLFLTDNEISEVLKKDYSCLMDGVRATDNKDEDISDYVIVYSANIYNNSYAIINYRVLDRSGNIAVNSRLAYLKSPEEIYNALLTSATNAAADAVTEWVEEDVVNNENTDEMPILEMEKIVNLEIGESFDPLDYLLVLKDDKDSFESLWENCYMEGTYDLNTAGIYPLRFFVTDSDGNESNTAVLILTVSMNEVYE